MTQAEHYASVADAHTLDELWAMLDIAHGLRRIDFVGAIMVKLNTREWNKALAIRKQNGWS